MRIVALIVLLITVAVVAFLGFCYYGAQMQVVAIYPTLTPAAQAKDAFDTLRHQLAVGSFIGTVYHDVELIQADTYAFLTLTVRMRNKGYFDQDYIQIKIQNKPADILQLAADRTPSLAGRSTADFSATLLIPLENAETTRSVTVSYYVLGRPYQVSVPVL